jgi:hypothetical protein
MKIKLGNTAFFITVTCRLPSSCHFLQFVTPPVMLSVTFLDMKCHVILYLQVEGHQFQVLFYPYFLHIHQGIYSLSLIFIGKLLRDLRLLIRSLVLVNCPLIKMYNFFNYTVKIYLHILKGQVIVFL